MENILIRKGYRPLEGIKGFNFDSHGMGGELDNGKVVYTTSLPRKRGYK